MAKFETLKKLAERHGMEAVDHGHGHWQVRGPLTVNYYPHARRGPTIYVNGTSRSSFTGSIDDAVRSAMEPPPTDGVHKEQRMSMERARKERRRLLKEDAHCHWCGCELTVETATLEHIIPLDRGGTNRRDNLTLACADCNHKRGNDMPELRCEK